MIVELIGLALMLTSLGKKKEEQKPAKSQKHSKKILKFGDENHNRFVENLAREINVPAEWIFGIMSFETAYTLSPKSKVNCPRYGQASKTDFCCGGLIGFCPVYNSSYTQYIDGSKVYEKGNILEQGIDYQLKYVRKFFIDGIKSFGKIKSKLDCYLLVFNPASIRYSSNKNHIVGSKGDGNMYNIRDLNPAFRDTNGYVTIRKIDEVINNWF